ncbi:MAG: hypothetical protein JWQ87_2371 [Candidatus Sulfotelmatobacter sp.]|nr:hypothetical protein [Candidatus Sulfotelmatobacter sp.]
MEPTTSPTSATARATNLGRRYVARQPILTSKEEVFGYELLFRNGVEDYFQNTDPDSASRSTVDTSMLMGLDPVRWASRIHQLHQGHAAQGLRDAAASKSYRRGNRACCSG